MATVTYVNNDYEVLAQAMQQLVTMGYFDSVEYDSENDAVVCKDADENAVLTLTAYSSSGSNRSFTAVSFRLDDGTVKTWNVNHSASSGSTNGYIGYIYVCSGGAYIMSRTATSGFSFIIISKTNNEKIGVIVDASSYNIAGRLSPYSVATDDDAEQADRTFSLGTPTTRNQETLVNVPTSASLNHAPSYFPDVYAEFTTQYTFANSNSTPPVSATVDGKNYLWVGYFMIADEEEES